MGAANRDPRRWPDANQLRLDRENPHPISFGHGIHHCLGAALARTEMRVGLSAFIDAFGAYTIDPTRLHGRNREPCGAPRYLRSNVQPPRTGCIDGGTNFSVDRRRPCPSVVVELAQTMSGRSYGFLTKTRVAGIDSAKETMSSGSVVRTMAVSKSAHRATT